MNYKKPHRKKTQISPSVRHEEPKQNPNLMGVTIRNGDGIDIRPNIEGKSSPYLEIEILN